MAPSEPARLEVRLAGMRYGAVDALLFDLEPLAP